MKWYDKLLFVVMLGIALYVPLAIQWAMYKEEIVRWLQRLLESIV